ncbi:MAG: M56 family metallopeptidase [Bacteroidota bacterium]
MMHLLTGTTGKMITAITSMLVHSIWQGLLLAIIAAGMLLLIKKDNAAARYNLLMATGITFLLGCIITFTWKWDNNSSNDSIIFTNHLSTPLSQLFFGNLHSAQQILKYFNEFIFNNQQWIFISWFLVMVYKMIRIATAILYNRRMKTRQVFEPDPYWKNKVTALSKKLLIKKTVTLLQSGYCKVPVVTGHLKPFILIPIGLLAGLPGEQAEAILLHELAHIRRNDYLVNCLQNIIETIFFFNPGVLWISSLLKEERENCCDDIALSQTQNRKGLAEALISFKEYELNAGFAPAFPGRKKHLLRRVTRILEIKHSAAGTAEKLFFTGAILVLVATGGITLLARMKEPVLPSSIPSQNSNRFLQPSISVIPAPDSLAKNKNPHKIHTVEKMTAAANSRVIENSFPPSGDIARPEQKTSAVKQLMEQDRAFAAQQFQQAVTDQEKARIDQPQAVAQQEQARIDQLQAKLDQEQAMKDQAQAKIDQQNAMAQQAQAMKDQVLAKANQEQAIQRKKQAERDKLKTESF